MEKLPNLKNATMEISKMVMDALQTARDNKIILAHSWRILQLFVIKIAQGFFMIKWCDLLQKNNIITPNFSNNIVTILITFLMMAALIAKLIRVIFQTID